MKYTSLFLGLLATLAFSQDTTDPYVAVDDHIASEDQHSMTYDLTTEAAGHLPGDVLETTTQPFLATLEDEIPPTQPSQSGGSWYWCVWPTGYHFLTIFFLFVLLSLLLCICFPFPTSRAPPPPPRAAQPVPRTPRQTQPQPAPQVIYVYTQPQFAPQQQQQPVQAGAVPQTAPPLAGGPQAEAAGTGPVPAVMIPPGGQVLAPAQPVYTQVPYPPAGPNPQ